MATFSDLVASLDADPAKRGRQFEVFVKWFLTADPEWATQVEQVWLWEEYPDRWGIDCGIDLIFRHKNGEIWSVQAKCYASSYDITKHDVDKFLSESNRKGIDKRLLIATTDRIGANAKQVCDAQEKTVVRYLLSNFESADVVYPATLAELHTAKRKEKPQPRAHQFEAITAVATNFENADRGQLIMACGTGKTFTTLWIKEHLASGSTLVLLPSLGLLSQTLHEWTLAANQPFDVLCVCSDDTVGKRGGDEAIQSVADLAFPVTSDTGEIRNFLKRDGARVVFSTYQSSPLVAEAQADASVQPFDLAIADEAHRCAGKVGSDFSTVLDSSRIRAKKRLFTTATPRTYSTSVKKAAGERGIEVVGMDDEAVFGKVLYALPFGEAIKRGLLTNYQVVIIGVDNPTIAAWIENRELLKTDNGIENDAESLAAQIGLLKAFKNYDLQRVISFHSRINRAESFTTDMKQVVQWIGEEHRPSGTLKTDFVSGAMPTDKRRRKLAQLKSLEPLERGLLANARCLSEGVDVPSLDGVAFIDPRSSQIDIIQAVGRAIRLSQNKKTGTIVLPVFIEDGDSPIESIKASNFKPIWDVLNALKAHDDVLSAEMDQLRTEMGRNSGSKVGAFSKIQIDLPSSVDQSFGDSLRTQLVEQVTESWEFWYGLLTEYALENGNCLVPHNSNITNGYKLGNWVTNQRARKNIRSPEQQAKLESLPGWLWNPNEDQWQMGFQHLKEYATRNGDCWVPQKFKLPNGYKLGQWLGVQRANKSEILSARVALLEALPGWTWNAVDERWETGICYLEQYASKHGDCFVPKSFSLPNGFRLGQWVASRRVEKESLTLEKSARLEAIPNWSWCSHLDKWEAAFSHLRDYCSAHGDCRVPQTFASPTGFKLGQWVRNQRSKVEEFSTERKTRLESITGWSWNTVDERWQFGFQKLQKYAKNNGGCLVPAIFRDSEGYPLGQWVQSQRQNEESLPVERKALLAALRGWTWKTNDDQWGKGLIHLKKYVKENQDCLVPTKFKSLDGYPLGTWVGTQRVNRKRLSAEQSARLEGLSGWTWDLYDEKWNLGFGYLTEYLAMHGSCIVPAKLVLPNSYRLGSWVSVQRLKREQLSAERIEKLESLAGWTWTPRSDLWATGFNQLTSFSSEYGHSDVPTSWVALDGFKLGQWLGTQRQRKTRLADIQAKRLEALPGWRW